MATYDHEITLIREEITEDEIGNQIPVESKTTVLCSKRSVTRNEFYNASNNGMKPSQVFLVHGYEYNNETKIEFEGKEYNVIRTYEANFEEIELTCERLISNA